MLLACANKAMLETNNETGRTCHTLKPIQHLVISIKQEMSGKSSSRLRMSSCAEIRSLVHASGSFVKILWKTFVIYGQIYEKLASKIVGPFRASRTHTQGVFWWNESFSKRTFTQMRRWSYYWSNDLSTAESSWELMLTQDWRSIWLVLLLV